MQIIQWKRSHKAKSGTVGVMLVIKPLLLLRPTESLPPTETEKDWILAAKVDLTKCPLTVRDENKASCNPFLQIHKEVTGPRLKGTVPVPVGKNKAGLRPPTRRKGQECFLEKKPGRETEVNLADTELLCENWKLLQCYFKGKLFWELKAGWAFQ